MIFSTGNGVHTLRNVSGAVLLLCALLASGVQADPGSKVYASNSVSSLSSCSVVNGEPQVKQTHLCTFCQDGYEMFRWGLDVGGMTALEEGADKLCAYLSKFTPQDCSEFVDSLLKKDLSYFDTVTPVEFCLDVDACHCVLDK